MKLIPLEINLIEVARCESREARGGMTYRIRQSAKTGWEPNLPARTNSCYIFFLMFMLFLQCEYYESSCVY